MTLSTKIRILHLFAVGLHTCTAVARSLCVSWAFLFLSVKEWEGSTAENEDALIVTDISPAAAAAAACWWSSRAGQRVRPSPGRPRDTRRYYYTPGRRQPGRHAETTTDPAITGVPGTTTTSAQHTQEQPTTDGYLPQPGLYL